MHIAISVIWSTQRQSNKNIFSSYFISNQVSWEGDQQFWSACGPLFHKHGNGYLQVLEMSKLLNDVCFHFIAVLRAAQNA